MAFEGFVTQDPCNICEHQKRQGSLSLITFLIYANENLKRKNWKIKYMVDL